MEIKECVICKRAIMSNDDYFKVDLFIEGKLKGTDHAHRLCWLNKNNFNNQLGELINGVSQFAIKRGFIPEQRKEMEIII